MGRPTPTAIRKLQGNPRRRPVNEHEPEPHRGLPEPPDFVLVDEYALEQWYSMGGRLDRAGILTEVDGDALAALCLAYSRWRQAEQVSTSLISD